MKINIKENGKTWDATFKQVIETGKKISSIKENKHKQSSPENIDQESESKPEQNSSVNNK